MSEPPLVLRQQSWLQRAVSSTREILSSAMLLAGTVAFFGPIILLGWQVLTWLRHGYWDRWPIERTLSKVGIFEPQTGWAGVRKIISYLFGMPTLLLILVGGIIVGGLLASIITWIDENHLADARVTYEVEGETRQQSVTAILRGKDSDAIVAIGRLHPGVDFKVSKIEWFPKV